MIKTFFKTCKNQKTSILLDAAGIAFLALLLLNVAHYSFLAKVLPGCHPNGLILAMECRPTLLGKTIGIFSATASPTIFVILFFNLHGLLLLFSDFSQFLLSLAFLSASILFLFLGLRILLRIIQLLSPNPKNKNTRLALLYLTLIFSPILIGYALKYWLIPPSHSHRIVHVDLWHNEFSVPRQDLHDWSLVKIQRSDTEPSAGDELAAKRKYKPFVELNLSLSLLAPSLNSDQMIRVLVTPRYKIQSQEDLFSQKRNLLLGILKETEYVRLDDSLNRTRYFNENGLPVADGLIIPQYSFSSLTEEGWTVYRGNKPENRGNIDIYVSYDDHENISHLMICNYNNSCHELMGGDEKYAVRYYIDKQHLRSFIEIHRGIQNYLNSIISP